VIRGVVFDLDGTLIDSWNVHSRCLRYAAVTTGAREPSAARLMAAQRPTDVQTLRILVGDDRLAAARRAYHRALRGALALESVPVMPGIAALLDQLRERGLAVGVCTGRSREDAQALLDASGLAVDVTVAREDASLPKPAPEGLLRAMRLLRLVPGEALYVGDSAADVKQGGAAGVRTLLVGPRGADARPGAPNRTFLIAELLDLPVAEGRR
jgi:HAD superfamily hydrolase (TIGR01509 family)